MRVTQNMKFHSAINNLYSSQIQYNDLMEKLATLKKVNRASDDPMAATKIIDIRQNMTAIAQYGRNIDNCNAWISATESKLSNAHDLLVQAQGIAVGQATATATPETRMIASQTVQSIIDEMAGLANTKLGERYLFSGSRHDVAPFSKSFTDARIEPAQAAADNVFQGAVLSSGAYTGTVNKSYVLKVTNGGAPAAATCQYSTDGGKTWNGSDLSLAGGSVNFGEGVSLTFDDPGGTETFGTNDVFHVNALAEGHYNGNSEELSVAIDRGTSITYNIIGAEAFTASGSSGVDIFKTLADLKDALSGNDVQGISGQLDHLTKAQTQITLSQSLCGTKANHIEMVKNNSVELNIKLTSLLSDAQDADLAEIATRLSMKEVALQASYAMAGRIGNMTILNFLK